MCNMAKGRTCGNGNWGTWDDVYDWKIENMSWIENMS